MVASAIYILDLKGKIIIARDYRGDVPKAAVEKCALAFVVPRFHCSFPLQQYCFGIDRFSLVLALSLSGLFMPRA
jgi:hypothetical protein